MFIIGAPIAIAIATLLTIVIPRLYPWGAATLARPPGQRDRYRTNHVGNWPFATVLALRHRDSYWG